MRPRWRPPSGLSLILAHRFCCFSQQIQQPPRRLKDYHHFACAEFPAKSGSRNPPRLSSPPMEPYAPVSSICFPHLLDRDPIFLVRSRSRSAASLRQIAQSWPHPSAPLARSPFSAGGCHRCHGWFPHSWTWGPWCLRDGNLLRSMLCLRAPFENSPVPQVKTTSSCCLFVSPLRKIAADHCPLRLPAGPG